jgi:hypothetical protein
MRHCTDAELNRRITRNYELRTAVHDKMIGPGGPGHPRTSPFTTAWEQLTAEYEALAAESASLYAELLRRPAHA